MRHGHNYFSFLINFSNLFYQKSQTYGDSPIPIPFISRINNNGVNYVELVMDNTFIEIKNESFTKLPKLDKIKKSSEECLQNPAVSEMCKTAFSFIIKYMTSHSS